MDTNLIYDVVFFINNDCRYFLTPKKKNMQDESENKVVWTFEKVCTSQEFLL